MVTLNLCTDIDLLHIANFSETASSVFGNYWQGWRAGPSTPTTPPHPPPKPQHRHYTH